MKKKQLVIASVLKPVDDTRMYEKFSLSLAKTNKYEINIIGFSAKKIPVHKHIHFYPIFGFQRLSLKRFMAPIVFFKLLKKIQPELIIITTYELLLPSTLYSWFWKGKFVYDIQENYAKNVVYNHGIPKPARYLWAGFVFLIEWGTRRSVTHYFLAEKGYQKELSFIEQKFTVLENKAFFSGNFQKTADVKDENKIRFIYSGTITKIYGIYQAIELFLNIKKSIPHATFIIIGHFPYRKDLALITSIAEQNPSIVIKGGLEPVPHAEIMEEVAQADFGFVSHQPVPSIENCFPTRIYEYMALRLPIILQHHSLWTSYCEKWDAAIVTDFNNYSCKKIVEQLQQRKFYQKGIPSDLFWQIQEEKKLLKEVDRIMKGIN
jgi:glycosyltransferase involved in cell wall biosynthesis